MIGNYKNPRAEQQYRDMLEALPDFPFVFTYDGKEHRGFSGMTFIDRETRSGRCCETAVHRWLLDDILTVTLEFSFYESHGVSEWTVWFENTSDRPSGKLSGLQSVLNIPGEKPVLRGIYGDHEKKCEPYAFDLMEKDISFRSDSGRATHVNFPYFDLECGDGGIILAIGWAGTWSADFAASENSTRCTLGAVNSLDTRLLPGEKIRTALFVTAPYTVRDENYAVNFWRSWYVECNLPRADASGKAVQPFSTCCLASDTGLVNSDGSISECHTTWRPSLEKMLAEDARVDYRWFDAGWYTAPDGGSAEPFVKGRDWWDTVGTWELDPVKWPGKTFLESTDFARANGMKTLMWFEPERVTYPDELVKNYGYKREWAIEQPGVGSISNNIGDDDCFRWTVERVCQTLRENKVEMYREDNNSDPRKLWDFLDAREGEDRRGITECKFILGHYRMWDEIIACTLSYGGCGFVDSCASGGGRNDLESMRRGIPLLRSDADRTSAALRLSMSSSFNKWIPFCGANTKEKAEELSLTGITDPYVWRASYLPALNVDSQFAQDPDQDFGILRFGLKEWSKVNRFLLKEFYPLTPWHSENVKNTFTAHCYFDPAAEEGVLLAFCQEECTETSLSLRLPFAESGSEWLLTDEDKGTSFSVHAGEDLTLTFDAPRTSRLLWICRK